MLASPNLRIVESDALLGQSATGSPSRSMATIGQGVAAKELYDISRSSAAVSNDNLDEVLAIASSAKGLIGSYSSAISREIFEGLMKQTLVLFRDIETDDEERLPSLDSFRTMLRTIVHLNPIARPSLGYGDSGNVLGAWWAPGVQAVVEFLPYDRIRWSLRTETGEERNVIAGTTGVREIRDIFVALGAGPLING